MRSIQRFEQPDILFRKKEDWTEKFIESNRTRPDNSKYGHVQIKTTHMYDKRIVHYKDSASFSVRY